jgi:phage terminase small subunit
MGQRGRLPHAAAIHKLKGAFSPSRHDRPLPPTAPGTIGKPPAGMSAAGRKLWQEVARAAPWLAEVDQRLLVVYVEANLRFSEAEREMRKARARGEGPGELELIERQIRRAATDIRETSRTLALAPTVRARLMMAAAAADEAGTDPWAPFRELRVVQGGKS